MTTTRYFEVKVTKRVLNCRACPHSPNNVRSYIGCGISTSNRSWDILQENAQNLTDTCPMWNETKESDMK